jgi:predicted transcriptional regulator
VLAKPRDLRDIPRAYDVVSETPPLQGKKDMRDESTSGPVSAEALLEITTEIVSSYVGNNAITADSLPDLIRSVYKTVGALGEAENEKLAEKAKPAVPVGRSITDDYIICLEDGKKLKMLKRYLRSNYGLSPEEYRKRWGLPADYPMVAPNYARRRSDFAKQIGLGRGVRRTKG